MKKNVFLIFCLLLSLIVNSQTVIRQPKVGICTARFLTIQEVEISDTATIVSFRVLIPRGASLPISDKSNIHSEGEDIRLFVKSGIGVVVNEEAKIPDSGELNYKLIFPAINDTVTKIDCDFYIMDKLFQIFDIELKSSATPQTPTSPLAGNWFNINTANWEISFIDSKVIYKSQIWTVVEAKLIKGKGTIRIKNNVEELTLHVKPDRLGTYWIGETAKTLKAYSQTQPIVKDDEKPFELPVFKQDSVTYSGYIKGYSPRLGFKTFSISIIDIILGKQNNFLIRIAGDGYFCTKLPVYYPNVVFVGSPFYSGSVFLEPGKDLFQLIEPGNTHQQSLFMGQSGKINTDLLESENIFRLFSPYKLSDKISEISPADYKASIFKLQNDAFLYLDSLYRVEKIGNRAYQVMKLEIRYTSLSHLLTYSSEYSENDSTTKNDQNTSNLLTIGFYDFINNELINNPLSVIGSSYDHFINLLKFCDMIITTNIQYSGFDEANELHKSGLYELTDAENKTIEKYIAMGQLLKSPDLVEFEEKFGAKQQEFFTKYQEQLQEILKDSEPTPIEAIKKHLTAKGVQFIDTEKELLGAWSEKEKLDIVKQINELSSKQFFDSINNIFSKYQDFTNYQGFTKYRFVKKRLESRTEILKTKFGVEHGIALDIMNAQDIGSPIVNEMTPVSDTLLMYMRKSIKDSFISEYISQCNEQVKADLQKKKTGLNIHEAPKTVADSLFSAIMQKFTGKVVYVDFWATWCSPCRVGIEQIKPLKEELATENVAFVYITGPSSPEEIWKNMITNIKGEHYRLTEDEWNELSNKFNVTAIPHTMLVDKNGVVRNEHLQVIGNDWLKAEIEKLMKE